jgi:hypothetical protein
MIARFTIAEPPDEAKHQTHRAHNVEQRAPTERAHQRKQERAEERKADVFANGVRTRRHGALVLRKPGGHDAAIGRKAWRFRDTQPEPQREQWRNAVHQPLREREERPERHRQKIRDLAAETIKKQAARNLRGHIAPGEYREHQPHQRGVDAQFLGQLWRRDAEHRAVEIIDHRADGEQREDPVARLRTAHAGCGGAGRQRILLGQVGWGGMNRMRHVCLLHVLLDVLHSTSAQRVYSCGSSVWKCANIRSASGSSPVKIRKASTA